MKPRKKTSRSERPTRAELEVEADRLRAQLEDRGDRTDKEVLLEAQAEIEWSRQLYVEPYDLAPVGYLTLDPYGAIRNLNFFATEMLGQERAKLIGWPLRQFVAPADGRRFLSYLSRLRRGQSRASIELNLRRRDGSPVTVQMVSVAHRQKDPSATNYYAALIDITERKRAEARTLATARFGLALSRAADPVAVARAFVDTAREYCGWDGCFVQVFEPGSDRPRELVHFETIRGRLVAAPAMHPDHAFAVLAQKAMREGPRLILQGGAREKAPLDDASAKPLSALLSLMFVPIRMEQRSIGVLSLQSRQPDAYAPQDLATLQGLADHVAVALARLEAEGALRRAKEQLEARVAERTAELRAYRDHLGELVQQRTRELKRANEQLQKEVASRRLAEEALRRAAEDFKRSNLELERFAYSISHDLQEPLRAVGGYVRLLELRYPEKLDRKMKEYIEGAAEGAIRMEQMITDLLAYSRVSTAGLELERVNLEAPLQAALHNLQFSIKAARANVTSDPLPVLLIDQGQMVRVFQNLISNALKFRNETPPQVHVGARQEPGRSVVWVRDNGIGIDPQYAERIFQVFQRVHIRKRYPGTGIGLATCKRIVERHGGSIWVESQRGQGSTFCFALPEAKE